MSLLFNFVELAALALTFIFFCFSADIFFQHSTHFRLYYLIAIGGLDVAAQNFCQNFSKLLTKLFGKYFRYL